MYLFDTHAHPHLCTDTPLNALVDRAKAAGLVGMMSVAIDLDSARDAIQQSEDYPGFIWPTAGIHPTSVADDDQITELEAIIQAHDVYAIGECGLDFYRDTNPSAGLQTDYFRAQLDIAKRYDLPVIIHARHADAELVPILLDYPDIPKVIHCFSSPWSVVEALLDTATWFSFTGIVTYTHYDPEVVERLPLHRMMIETDCPYLTPLSHRGTANEPAFVSAICAQIAAIKSLTPETVAAATTQTAIDFFKLPTAVPAT